MYIEYEKRCDISTLVGKTILSIGSMDVGSDSCTFVCDDGSEFIMYHDQNCCESVSIEDIEGAILDLIGSPIVLAEEASNIEDPPAPEHAESYTWTFYRIATSKGFVVIRWLGESNGYYGESVDFAKIK